ncbi:hypothetical protein [Amycolatopsis sp. NPDC004625]|uniref:hypothetical protein n=1 Tax=Amycolatopsis sp. NPDC004625 TaxID=3154670 RepID=UPI0033AB1706
MRRSILLAGVFAIAAVVLTAGPASADDLVDLPSGASATLPAEAGAIVLLPLAPAAGVDVTGLTARVVRVVRDGVPVAAETVQAIGVRIEPAVLALRFDVRVDALARVGDYTATVAVGSGGRSELVDVVLKRPGADLQATATIDVKRTVWIPEWGIGGPRDERPDLHLVAGPDTRITQFFVTGLDSSTDRIEVTAPATPMSGRSAQTLGYAIAGTPPLGTVTRTVQIDSAQLTRPLTVQFRVTTRRDPALIVIFALLGLFAGVLVRRTLVAVQDRAAAVGRATELAARLEELIAGRADGPFREEIGKLLTGLDAKSGRWLLRPVAGLDAAVTAAEAKANELLEELDAGLAAVAAALPEQEKVIRPDWTVPGTVPWAGVLAEARGCLDELDALLNRGDLTRARTALDNLENDVGLIAGSARRYVADVIEGAGRLGPVLAARPVPAFGPVAGRARRLATLVPPAADAEPLAVLSAAYDAGHEQGELVTRLGQAVDEFAVALRTPEAAARAAEVRTALGASLPLSAAADRLPGLLALAKTELGRSSEAEKTAAGVTGAIVRPAPHVPARRAVARSRVSLGRRQVLAAGVGWAVGLTRFTVLSFVLSLIAYRWLEPTWTGTLGDILVVFTWAFALDVSVGAVTTAMSGRPAQLTPTTIVTQRAES